MNKDFIKKYWFMGIVAVALLVFVGLYCVDAYNNREIKVNNKEIEGKYIVYTVDGDPVYADEFFDSLYAKNGFTQSFIAFERAVFNKAYETTDEMKEIAAQSSQGLLSNYSKDYIISSLEAMGYINGIDDVTQYYIDNQKQTLLTRDYLEANYDEYVAPRVGKDGRLIYHILISCKTTPVYDDKGNIIAYNAEPTESQENALQQVKDYLADENNSFEYCAYQFSDDTGTANSGGYVGLISTENASRWYDLFSKKALELKDGEVSDVLVTEAGYHIIYNAGSSKEAILNDNYYIAELEQALPNLVLKAVLKKADEFDFEIKSQALQDEIDNMLESGN